MKILIHLTIFLAFATSQIWGQGQVNGDLNHDGENRTYILYEPVNFDQNKTYPLVFNFHGLSSAAWQQYFYGDFRKIADTANFIIVLPQGLKNEDGITHWNVGQSNADDVGFVSALIDELAKKYNVDMQRIYATGMSNGGIMSYYLACQLGNRFAAVASVTGLMAKDHLTTCTLQKPMPTMHIHGTADHVLPYMGSDTFMSVQEIVDHWIDHNKCNSNGAISVIPDINTADGCNAEHFVYQGGTSGASVELFKVNNGGHSWPGAPLIIAGVACQDFNACEEIWRFFSKYNINGVVGVSDKSKNDNLQLLVYPNPTQDVCTINWGQIMRTKIIIRNCLGKQVYEKSVRAGQHELRTNDWQHGLYFVDILHSKGTTTERLLIK